MKTHTTLEGVEIPYPTVSEFPKLSMELRCLWWDLILNDKLDRILAEQARVRKEGLKLDPRVGGLVEDAWNRGDIR